MIVYKATNTLNGKRYVGITKNSLEVRRSRHLYDSNAGKKFYFSRAIRKHGIDAFEWKILDKADNWKELCDLEHLYIGLLRPEYNLTDGGEGTPGIKVSESTRKKLSIAGAKRKTSDETKKKLSESKKGIKFSIESRKKMSEANKGKKLSIETRRKMSMSRLGHKVSLETRDKLKDAWKRRINNSSIIMNEGQRPIMLPAKKSLTQIRNEQIIKEIY